MYKRISLTVLFNFATDFGGATIRQYIFMLEGMKKFQNELKKKNIPLYAISGKTKENIPKFINFPVSGKSGTTGKFFLKHI